jgi:hypothetical protein
VNGGPGFSVDARRAGAVILGLLIAGTLAAIDTSEPPHSIVIGTVVLAPFIVSTIAGPRETAIVGGVAFLLAVVSGFWNENFETGAYYLRATVVLVGAAISVLAASARERTTRDQARFALLAELADVADGRLTLDETADRVCELIVPGFADLCVIDVVHQDGLRRLAVRFAGPGMADQEAALRARDPTLPGQPGSGETVETGTPELLEVVSDDVLRAAAHDDADLALLRSIRYRSMIIVPLSARGRTLGALSLAVTERSRPPLRLRGAALRRGAGRPGGARPRQRRAVHRAPDDGGPADRCARQPDRSRDGPRRARRAHLCQPGRRGPARLRLAAGAAGHARAGDRQSLRVLSRGRHAARPDRRAGRAAAGRRAPRARSSCGSCTARPARRRGG